MGDRADGIIGLFFFIFLAFLFIWMGKHSGPEGQFVFGNVGKLLLMAIIAGVIIGAILLLTKE